MADNAVAGQEVTVAGQTVTLFGNVDKGLIKQVTTFLASVVKRFGEVEQNTASLKTITDQQSELRKARKGLSRQAVLDIDECDKLNPYPGTGKMPEGSLRSVVHAGYLAAGLTTSQITSMRQIIRDEADPSRVAARKAAKAEKSGEQGSRADGVKLEDAPLVDLAGIIALASSFAVSKAGEMTDDLAKSLIASATLLRDAVNIGCLGSIKPVKTAAA